MMNRFLTIVSVCAAVPAFAALPEISNLTVSQPQSGKPVTVSYGLSHDAVVTADILTNGVSIGAQRFERISGDINCKVNAGASRSFTWQMRKDWPNQKLNVSVRLRAWLPGAAPDYMVVDLLKGGAKRFYASAEDVPGGVTDEQYKTDKLVMRRVHAAGEVWRMGQPATGERCNGNSESVYEYQLKDNETAHLVGFTEDYYIGIYEVTQRQYLNVTGSNPSDSKAGSSTDRYDGSKCRPVEKVSYNMLRGTSVSWPQNGHAVDSGSVIQKFRQKLGLQSADLPTDAQWEFACRAGTQSALNSGLECKDAISAHADGNLEVLGWYFGNANVNSKNTDRSGPRDVGLKQPNAWGLYDMHGNVHEVCLDWMSKGDAWRATFVSDWKQGGVTIDPVGATSGTSRVNRGGDYWYSSAWARSACRTGYVCDPSLTTMHIGFRLVCNGTLD